MSKNEKPKKKYGFELVWDDEAERWIERYVGPHDERAGERDEDARDDHSD